MKRTRARHGFPATAIAVAVVLASARAASAQHVTVAMAASMGMPALGSARCEARAREAAMRLDMLNTNLARARQTDSEPEMRAALDALAKGFAEVKGGLDACRAGAASPAAQSPADGSAAGAMAGMDHSKMNMGGAQPPPLTPPGGAMAGMDHSKMTMTAAQPAAAPSATGRPISGPAEAALQSFEDALQIGNRDIALQWLAAEATISEAGVTDRSREAYAQEHMALDMAFLKTAKVVLLDRQVQPSGDSTRIVSTSRVTGRAGEISVDVTVTEGALLKRTSQGWRVVSIEWTLAPIKTESR